MNELQYCAKSLALFFFENIAGMFILEEKFCGLSRHHSQEGQQETQSVGADYR